MSLIHLLILVPISNNILGPKRLLPKLMLNLPDGSLFPPYSPVFQTAAHDIFLKDKLGYYSPG